MGHFSMAQNDKTDLEKAGLNGQVKSMVLTGYDVIEDGDTISKGKRNGIIEMYFNDLGVITELKDFDAEMKLISNHKSFYNEQEKITKEIRLNANDVLTEIFTYKYDHKGYLTELVDSGGLGLFVTRYKYDTLGNKTEKIVYKNDSIIKNKAVYTYYPDGNRKEWYYYNQRTMLLWKIEYIYDKNKVIEELTYDDNEELFRKKVIKYNDRNDIIEECKYDASGKKVSSYSYYYEYDEMENWVLCIHYKNDKSINILERKINY